MIKHTYLPDSSITPKLTREEYSRYFAGIIGVHDFCTEHPSPHNINKIARTLYQSNTRLNSKKEEA